MTERLGTQLGRNIMSTLNWVGGGANQASDPANWAPADSPLPGDTLTVGSPGKTKAFVMNVRGDDLAGDTLNTIDDASLTANLSQQASMSAGINFGAATFDLSEQSTLDLSLSHAAATVNLSDRSTLNFAGGYGNAIVNVSGHDTLAIGRNAMGPLSAVEVNLLLEAKQLDLVGLATADSYTYQSSQLSIFSGNTVLASLRVVDKTPHGFVVKAPREGKVDVVAIVDPAHPPVGLPVHV